MTVRWRSRVLLGVAFAAALPAQKPKDELEVKIQAALEAARPALLDHLEALHQGQPGELALMCLAALHDNLPRTDKQLAVALKRLGEAQPHTTYELALRLMVLETDTAFPGRDALAKEDAAHLLKHNRDAGFHYNSNDKGWDLSNSQYGALGLRAAVALGVEVPVKVWRALATTVLDSQQTDGGFCYIGQGGSYLSMTVAGISVLKICEAAMVKGNQKIPEIDRAVERAWRWLDKHSDQVGNTEIPWCLYAHYGLERAGILSDVTKVGGQDWYRVGAKMLVERQENGGGWKSKTDGFPGTELRGGRGQGVPTAFAVLFLRRKFQKLLTPVTLRILALKQIVDETPEKDMIECVDQLVRRGKPAIPDVLEGVRDDVPRRRQAAVLALRRIAGDDFGIDPKQDPEQNREAVRRAELWYLKNR
jgi:hypothetical protein